MLKERKEYLLNEEKTKLLLTRFATWYHKNYSAFETVLDSFSSNIESDALVDVLNDMDAPWSSLETYVLLAYLDPDEYGFVTTEMLIRLASFVQQENDTPAKDFGATYDHLPMPTRQNRVPVFARFASSQAPECPLNLSINIDGERTLQNLGCKILCSVDIPSNKVLMKSDQQTQEYLDESTKINSLEDSGYVELFYDYKVALTDCPIVNDYSYFIRRTIDRMINL
ncbi:hypothetical protein FBUS_03049 [Fasciolopsis buskii]|uniref:Uncharacterized protein n=1 Tax=Fasciolopsis buskii TaxID=27845 RepID=A0A8E0VFN4_9TREM|nr:hypothetical protein FBUS_03049 [Fasciolopsis buski]